MVDGEILETLWSTLNSISPSMRTASLAHRSEVLDDHMNDSNWKKIVSIRESAFFTGSVFGSECGNSPNHYKQTEPGHKK
jgi:hypothetical protein